MPKYKVSISGQNYLLPCDGEPQKIGFSQAFYLRAASPEKAREEAVALVTRDASLVQNALNGPADPFRIVVDSVRWAGPFKLFADGPGKRIFSLEKGEDEADEQTAACHC